MVSIAPYLQMGVPVLAARDAGVVEQTGAAADLAVVVTVTVILGGAIIRPVTPRADCRQKDRHYCPLHDDKSHQQTHYAIMTSLLRHNDVILT